MKDKTTERIIGARIQKLRKAKGYTQQALSLIHISEPTRLL